jgi:hypothetical protein
LYKGTPLVQQIPALTLGAEVQSITVSHGNGDGSFRVGAVDSQGRGVVSSFSEEAWRDGEDAALGVEPSSSFRFAPRRACESGWAGVSLSPLSSSSAAVAHSFSRQIFVVDSVEGTATASVTRDWHAAAIPTAIAHVHSSSPAAGTVVVAEMSAISAWDPRASGRACVARDTPGMSSDMLFCIAADGNAVAVAGEASTVHIYDVRTWTVRAKWHCPAKHQILGVSIDEPNQLCWVAGADQEVLCGRFQSGGGAGGAVGGGAGDGRRLHDGGFTGAGAGSGASSGPPKRPRKAGGNSGEGGDGQETATTATTTTTTGGPKGPPPKLGAYLTGFRGDTRWVGLSVLPARLQRGGTSMDVDGEGEAAGAGSGAPAPSSAVLLAVSEGGYAYVVGEADRMDVTGGK